MAKKPVAKSEAKDPVREEKRTNGKRWKTVERKRYRYWKADDDSTPITGVLMSREDKAGRYGVRGIYVLKTTEAGEDRKGEYGADELIAVSETAVLKDLVNLIGQEVRITPAGIDDTGGNRVKLFDVEVAE